MSTIKKTAVIFGTLLLSVCLLFSACASQEEVQVPFPDVDNLSSGKANYKTHTVAEGDIFDLVERNLFEFYPKKAELRCEQNNSVLQEVHIKKGQAVKQGDVLMTFVTEFSAADSAQLRLQRQRSWENYLEGKNARLSAIESAKEAAKHLTGYDLQIANYEIEKMQAQYDQYVFQTTRSVYAIDDQIRALEGTEETSVLVAPFDGVIDTIADIKAGDPVTPQTVLITMHSEDTLLLSAWVTDGIRYNWSLNITPVNNPRDIPGRVIVSENILPSSVTSYNRFMNSLVKVDEPLSELDLLALAYTAEYQMLKNVLIIPKRAVHGDDDKSYVYVLDGDTLQKRYITITSFDSSSDVWVRDGLSAGETIIIE